MQITESRLSDLKYFLLLVFLFLCYVEVRHVRYLTETCSRASTCPSWLRPGSIEIRRSQFDSTRGLSVIFLNFDSFYMVRVWGFELVFADILRWSEHILMAGLLMGVLFTWTHVPCWIFVGVSKRQKRDFSLKIAIPCQVSKTFLCRKRSFDNFWTLIYKNNSNSWLPLLKFLTF